MTRSAGRNDGRRSGRLWMRRAHRWLGLTAVLFVLLLSLTGIAINHGTDWQLDRRYVDWDWLLDAYGVHAPPPTVSFADGGHRATKLGGYVYFDAREVPRQVESLTGLVVVGPLAVLTTASDVLVLTRDGDFVQAIDLGGELPAPIARVGRLDGRPLIDSGGELFVGDADVTRFERLTAVAPRDVSWSAATPPPAELAASLGEAWRGRGLTVERVLTDLHSGRIVGPLGPLLLDLVGIGLVVLSISGLVVWVQRRTGSNGRNGTRRR